MTTRTAPAFTPILFAVILIGCGPAAAPTDSPDTLDAGTLSAVNGACSPAGWVFACGPCPEGSLRSQGQTTCEASGLLTPCSCQMPDAGPPVDAGPVCVKNLCQACDLDCQTVDQACLHTCQDNEGTCTNNCQVNAVSVETEARCESGCESGLTYCAGNCAPPFTTCKTRCDLVNSCTACL